MVFTIELGVIAAVTVTYICTFAQPFCFSPIISVLIYVCFYLFAEINFVLNVSKFYHRLTNRSLPYICCSARKFSRSFIDTIFLYQRSQTPTASALGKILYIDFRTKTKQNKKMKLQIVEEIGAAGQQRSQYWRCVNWVILIFLKIFSRKIVQSDCVFREKATIILNSLA